MSAVEQCTHTISFEEKYIGKRFGRLTILELSKPDKTNRYKRSVLCLCTCGNTKKAVLYDIIRTDGRSVSSCGCYKREKTVERCLEDLTGQRFGKLFVVRYAGAHHLTGAQWECLCDCGKTCISKATRLKCGMKKSCGCYQKSSGSEHWNWDPNIPLEDKLNKRGTVKNLRYEKWRKEVYDRDDYTCQITGKRGKNIQAHHLYSWNKYEDLRYDINNGITLSAEIHKLFHKKYGKGNNTKEQFEEFKQTILSCASCES